MWRARRTEGGLSARLPPNLRDLISGKPQLVHYVGCDCIWVLCEVALDEGSHVRDMPVVSARALGGRDGTIRLDRIAVLLANLPVVPLGASGPDPLVERDHLVDYRFSWPRTDPHPPGVAEPREVNEEPELPLHAPHAVNVDGDDLRHELGRDHPPDAPRLEGRYGTYKDTYVAAILARDKVRIRMCLSKDRYESESAANLAIHDREAKTGLVLRSYQCPCCGGYHLTKMPLEEYLGAA